MALRVLMVVLVACVGCGGDDGGNGTAGTTGGTGMGASPAASECYRQCESQEHVEGGCTPIVDLATCKVLCDQLVAGLDPACAEEFDGYYACSADAGFACFGGFVSQKDNACMAELDALNACTGGMGCEGQNDNGVCPQVACPCPEGTKMVSGVDTGPSGCKCLDEMTCRDLFCD